MIEILQEGWVKFSRIHCTAGFIDVWYGDCAHNPNSEAEPRWCLNSTASFIRLDGKDEWVGIDYRGIKSFVGTKAEKFTSQEIWNEIEKWRIRQ